MTHPKKRKFKTIWEVVKAAKAEIEKHSANPVPDLQAIKQELKEFRQAAGHFFNVEHPSYKDVGQFSQGEEQYVLPLNRTELEEVYGNALFNTLVANYLSVYIQELEELETAPAHEC
jgi:hypothetical protein